MKGGHNGLFSVRKEVVDRIKISEDANTKYAFPKFAGSYPKSAWFWGKFAKKQVVIYGRFYIVPNTQIRIKRILRKIKNVT